MPAHRSRHRAVRRLRRIACLLAALGLVAPAMAAATPSTVGVNVNMWTATTPSELDGELEAAQRLNGNVVRHPVYWSNLMPFNRGEVFDPYVAQIDDVVARARAHGQKIVMVFLNTPCWAQPRTEAGECGSPTNPPSDPKDYADALSWAVERWHADLAAVEIWNEPNLGYFTAPDKPAAYAELVREAYPAVKKTDFDGPVLAGALAGSDTAFLEQVYAAGIHGSYDALAVHAYAYDQSPDAELPPWFAQNTFRQGLLRLREVQQQHDEVRPVWITEFGWSTTTTRGTDYPWLNGVSEEDQAAYLGRAFELLADPASGLGFVDAAVVFSLRDLSDDLTSVEHNFGLLRRDFSEKPSFDVVQAAMSKAVGR